MINIYITMTKTYFINPFSSDAKEVIREHGDVEKLEDYNEELLSIITHTPGQIFDVNSDVPDNLYKLSCDRIRYYLLKKSNNLDEKRYEYLFNPEIAQYDVVSFYLLCQAVAIGYGVESRQSKLLKESQLDLISQRLELLKADGEFITGYLRKIINQFHDSNHTDWKTVKNELEMANITLDKLLLVDGRIILEYEDFIDEFGELIEYRDPRSMYQVTSGTQLKIAMTQAYILTSMMDYMANVEKKSKHMIEPNKLLVKLADEIHSMEAEHREAMLKSNPSAQAADIAPNPLNMEALPPCVRKCMDGIKSGGRNDAIVLFLTPFISYARLCPGIFKLEGETVKVSEVDPDLSITTEEVIPLIYDVAESCVPPLFSDQPNEVININSKLGFGMHDKLNIKHEGETSWYTPMSCEKTKLHLSTLCTPNVDCKKIGNPLTYYNRKNFILGKQKTSNDNKVE